MKIVDYSNPDNDRIELEISALWAKEGMILQRIKSLDSESVKISVMGLEMPDPVACKAAVKAILESQLLILNDRLQELGSKITYAISQQELLEFYCKEKNIDPDRVKVIPEKQQIVNTVKPMAIIKSHPVATLVSQLLKDKISGNAHIIKMDTQNTYKGAFAIEGKPYKILIDAEGIITIPNEICCTIVPFKKWLEDKLKPTNKAA